MVVMFNLIEAKSNPFDVPFPGEAWLIGGAMLVNLLAAHTVRFKLTWSRGGIMIIHAGIIIMMLSEVITGLYANEGQLVVQIGMTSNFGYPSRHRRVRRHAQHRRGQGRTGHGPSPAARAGYEHRRSKSAVQNANHALLRQLRAEGTEGQ